MEDGVKIARPKLPEWYVPDPPMFLYVAEELTPEERHTLTLLWACACEAIRKGEEPIWARTDLVAMLQQTGLTASQAYRRLEGLIHKTLRGKRLLWAGSAQEWVSAQGGIEVSEEEAGLAQERVSASDRGSSPKAPRGRPGWLIGLGEAFEADLIRIRRKIRIDANFRIDANPNYKRGTLYRGEGDIDHDIPPPPNSIYHNIRIDAKNSPDLQIDAERSSDVLANGKNESDPVTNYINKSRRRADQDDSIISRTDAKKPMDIRTDAKNYADEIRGILEEAGIFPAKAAELAALLAERGLTPDEVHRWVEAQLPELRRAAERTGGDPISLLVWRLEQGIGRPEQAGEPRPPPLPPLRPLTEAERAAWERARAMVAEGLNPFNRSILERLELIGIQDDGLPRILGIRVPRGNYAAIRLVESSTLRYALYQAFGEIIDPVPVEADPASSDDSA